MGISPIARVKKKTRSILTGQLWKFPKEHKISSWYSKKKGSTWVSRSLGPLRELHYWMPRVFDGFYLLARNIKSVLFSLGTLSSCREPPVHLGIEKEHPKLLILQSTRKEFSWLDNRVHESITLTNAFPSKRKSALRYGLKYLLIKCSSHLVNPTDSILIGQHQSSE